jgi:hypothetical protein
MPEMREGELVCWILLGWVSPCVSVAVTVTDELPSSLRSMFRRYFENIALRSSVARLFVAMEVSTTVTCPTIVETVSSIFFCLVSRADILPASFPEYPCHSIPTTSALLNFEDSKDHHNPTRSLKATKQGLHTYTND